MASKVGVTPEQVRGAAGKMGDLRDRMNTILTNLAASLDAKGAPWGGDGYGSTFADGDQGYIAARENLTTGIGNTAKTFDSYSDGQYKAVELLARTEQRSTDSFT
ncbi:WXG100 family type VII secretion target [Nocardia sp. NPDC058519]|uniref:WXG100 family type VII secretion target n=1 Tax=Nocardia sp. NPDC058519 TaxID=3346535 RepID=UPI00364F4470